MKKAANIVLVQLERVEKQEGEEGKRHRLSEGYKEDAQVIKKKLLKVLKNIKTNNLKMRLFSLLLKYLWFSYLLSLYTILV